jgi:small subunit ribosomal protein S1
VDLGGLEGLVHVSELSHARVLHAQDVVKQGQRVRVQVIRIDPPKDEKDTERIALSMRALEQDPWDAHKPELTEGKKLQGKVVRLQPFGAFVELFPGVDGLVHVSALSNRHVNHPREVVTENEQIWVQIDSVDFDQHRVSLRRITEEEAKLEGPVPAREERRGGRDRDREAAPSGPPQKRARQGDVLQVTVDKCEVYGVFVKWDQPSPGRGLVPNPELGTPRGSDNKKIMPPGTAFKAVVLEIDQQGRYRLSKVAVEAAAERAELEEYKRTMQKSAGKGFGTLGDLLRAKLGK